MYRLVSIIMVCLLLAACTTNKQIKTEKPIVSKEKQTESSKISKEQEDEVKYYISGDVMTSPQGITIIGRSNLLQGTVLEVSFETDELKPMKVTVGEDGYIDEYIPRPSSLTTDVTMVITMKPDQQSEQLKKKYGLDGKNISEDYKSEYKSKGKTFVGIKVQGEMVGVNEHVSGGNELLQPVSR
ncbi:hypothetical protein ACQKCU_09820 [Heyndrickxia sporothermodurans]